MLGGKLKPNDAVMTKDGKEVGMVKGLQKDNENVKQAGKNAQVAVSVDGLTIGRQANEGDVLYTALSEDQFQKLKALKKHLSEDEKEVIKEIAEIRRRQNPVWGV